MNNVCSDDMRNFILRMTDPSRFYIDISHKDDVPQESFRKLNVD